MSDNGHTDLQREAAEVFDRVLAGFDRGTPPPAPANGDGTKASRVRLTQLRSAAARTLDLYGELFQRAFETYADLAQAAVQPGTDPAPETPLALTGHPGGEAATRLWLHNVTDLAVADIDLLLTDLTAADGSRIGAAAAAFSPRRIDVEPGASATSLLRVAIPPAAVPGVYFGHVLSGALPTAALGVRLAVAP